MQVSAMYLRAVIISLITILLGVGCIGFGLYFLLSKKAKKENKTKGIFLLVAGFCLIFRNCFFIF